MKKLVGKCICFLIVVLLLITLAGCKSSEYEKAIELYDSGDYKTAMSIFAELGDYEESDVYLHNSKWFALVDYIVANGTRMDDGRYMLLKNIYGSDASDTSLLFGIGISGSDKDNLIFAASEFSGTSVVSLSNSCLLNSSRTTTGGTYFLDTKFEVYSAYTKASSYGNINLNDITETTKLDYTRNISSETVDIYGKVKYNEDIDRHKSSLENSQELLPMLLQNCREILENTGLGITLADLGFTSYK